MYIFICVFVCVCVRVRVQVTCVNGSIDCNLSEVVDSTYGGFSLHKILNSVHINLNIITHTHINAYHNNIYTECI